MKTATKETTKVFKIKDSILEQLKKDTNFSLMFALNNHVTERTVKNWLKTENELLLTLPNLIFIAEYLKIEKSELLDNKNAIKTLKKL